MRQTALITGARSGIGYELTKRLLSEDWRVISLNRTPFSNNDPFIKNYVENGSLREYIADLSDFKQLKDTLTEIKVNETAIDIIFNNAGSMAGKLMFSPQGREIDFEINTVVPFIIFKELMEMLKNGNVKTTINVSSNTALQTKNFNPETLERPGTFTKMFGSYASSKLALSLWTKAIAPEMAEANIKIRSVHPGPSKTPLSRSSGVPWFILLVRPFVFSHPRKGADRVYEAAFGKFKTENGIFIMNGKNTRLKFKEKSGLILEKLNAIYENAFK